MQRALPAILANTKESFYLEMAPTTRHGAEPQIEAYGVKTPRLNLPSMRGSEEGVLVNVRQGLGKWAFRVQGPTSIMQRALPAILANTEPALRDGTDDETRCGAADRGVRGEDAAVELALDA
jgi:hypothetical protein